FIEESNSLSMREGIANKSTDALPSGEDLLCGTDANAPLGSSNASGSSHCKGTLFGVESNLNFDSTSKAVGGVHGISATKINMPYVLEKELVLVYNRFAQLMNDMERNGIIFPKVTINTKLLNCLQPEWLKGKKLEKSYDPLALVAHMGTSSRTITPYYVTHPSSVVDYDDDYQRDAV
ncbi:hypothetical protein Tco_1004773, partial [Tanacetum coccineum]